MGANQEIIAELRRVLNERDEAREQLDLTKRELGRWVDRETKAARERDEARELYEDCLICNRNLFGIINDRTEERDKARAEADRWKRSCNVFRERDWPKAFQATVTSLEQEVSDAHEQLAKLRKLSKPWEGDAYRRGAEAMREHIAEVAGRNAALEWVVELVRALPIPENK